MQYTYATKGTCSTKIIIDMEDGIINEVRFIKGCDGNLKSLGRLVKGQPADKVAALLRGVTCEDKGTSCGDQLSRALTLALQAQQHSA